MHTIYVKLTMYNTTTADFNYKVLQDRKWDHVTLANNTFCISALKFL